MFMFYVYSSVWYTAVEQADPVILIYRSGRSNGATISRVELGLGHGLAGIVCIQQSSSSSYNIVISPSFLLYSIKQSLGFGQIYQLSVILGPKFNVTCQ